MEGPPSDSPAGNGRIEDTSGNGDATRDGFAPEANGPEILRPSPSDLPRDARPDVLVRELNHRIRNIFGTVRALMTVSRRAVPGMDELADEFLGRLEALARAQDQSLGRARAPDLGLAELVAEELTPFTGRYGPVSRIEGPEVYLSRRGRMVVSLVLHELATNAVKYGALGSGDGMVEVLWTLEEDGDLSLRWLESGGPKVESKAERGFGTGLLSETVPLELDGKAEIEIGKLGLSAVFTIPSRHLVEQGKAPAGTVRPVPDAVSLLAGRHVLLAEDNVVIAYDLEDMVMGLGAQRVTVATSLSDAVAAIEKGGIDFAILDINLGNVSAVPAAEALHLLGTPFIFASGQTKEIPHVSGVPMPLLMEKPYSTAALALAVATALMGRN